MGEIMTKAKARKRLTKNLGHTRLHRNPALAKPPTPVSKPLPMEAGLTIVDLKRGQCKWHIGENEDGETIFCGKERLKGENISAKNPYCATHYKIGLQKYSR